MALREALANAVEHGNWRRARNCARTTKRSTTPACRAPRQQSPYRDRRVFVAAEETRCGVTYSIRDEGPGFDPVNLPDPTDPANWSASAAAACLLIHAFMDEVRHNATGNEVTMVKRLKAS